MSVSAYATADQALVRELNSALVLRALRTRAPLSRAQVAKQLRLNRSTISSIVGDLLSRNLVRETELARSNGGRPGMLLELNPAGGCLVGVDLNIDLVSVVLTDFTGNVLDHRQVEFDPGVRRGGALELAESLIEESLAEGRARGLAPLGIGVGVAALVDSSRGRPVYAPFLGWEELDLGPRWGARFALPVRVENEANAGALAECFFGGAKGTRNMIFVSVGVGLAAGIIVDGRLLRGSHSFAGQIGHTGADPDGLPCSCGKRGCTVTRVGLEAISAKLSPHALEPERPDSHVTFRSLARAAHAGDPDVLRVLSETGRLLGQTIADLVTVLDTETVVVGGPLSPVVPFLLPAIRQAVTENRLGPGREPVRVEGARYGGMSCAVGAVAAVVGDLTRESALLPAV